jgi:hypothetical protein
MERNRRRLLPALASFLLIALAPDPAAAQRPSRRPPEPPPSPSAQAEAYLADGNFQAALDEYRRLLDQTGDPIHRLGVARALAGLQQPLDAIAAYDRLLAEAGEALPPSERAAAEAERAAQEALTAVLEIEIDVEGAEIRVDTRSVGWSPAVGPQRLLPGPHTVEAYHPQRLDVRRHVELAAGRTERLVLATDPLPPPPDPLRIDPEVARRQVEAAEAAAAARWSRGGWLPIPRVLPYGWADHVPAGAMLSVGVAAGAVTETEFFDDAQRTMGVGAGIPALAGFRFPDAPMFGLAGWFHWQFHSIDVTSLSGITNAEAWGFQAGLKLRVWFPLGLLEPFVSTGLGYTETRQEYDRDSSGNHRTWILRGMAIPIELGLDIVPFDFLAAGFAFQFLPGIGLQQCQEDTRPDSNKGCYAEGDTDPATGMPLPWRVIAHQWSFLVHVTLYLG